jgi:hypothetical protein
MLDLAWPVEPGIEDRSALEQRSQLAGDGFYLW